MIVPDIGINDTRQVIQILKDIYGLDFKDYALTSFMRSLERTLKFCNFRSITSLTDRLQNDKSFLDLFLRYIAVEETEIFRDPSLWRLLKKDIFIDAATTGNMKIWLPSCVTGEELYSLLITLHEQKIDDVQITATCSNDISLKDIQKGILKLNKVKISEENYTRVQGQKDNLDYYYEVDEQHAIIDNSLLKNVNFIKQNIIFDNSPKENHLILFRNRMLYYNYMLKDRILEILYNSLKEDGFLILGAKESISSHEISRKFNVFSIDESIYRKKIRRVRNV
jgi:chemotaxis protein methyltransferase CheR